MNFAFISYFLMAERTRSFTRAAEQLHITQQSLSAAISSLEKELGSPLFIRSIPLELTYAGEVFLTYAKNFQKDRIAMMQEFGDISQNQKGVLRVGTGFTRGRILIPRILPVFGKLFPNICVELWEGNNDVLTRQLQEGDIDLAIAGFTDNPPGVVLEDFYREEVVLVMTRSLAQKMQLTDQLFPESGFSILKDVPFILGREDDIGGRVGAKLFRKAGISRPVVRAISDNLETRLALVLRDIGACFCPRNLMEGTLSAGDAASLLVVPTGPEGENMIHFGYVKKNYQWSVIEAFIRCAREPGAVRR